MVRASLAEKADAKKLNIPRTDLSSFFHLLILTDRAEAMIVAVHYKNIVFFKKTAVIWVLNAILAPASPTCLDSCIDFDGTNFESLRMSVWFRKSLSSLSLVTLPYFHI